MASPHEGHRHQRDAGAVDVGYGLYHLLQKSPLPVPLPRWQRRKSHPVMCGRRPPRNSALRADTDICFPRTTPLASVESSLVFRIRLVLAGIPTISSRKVSPSGSQCVYFRPVQDIQTVSRWLTNSITGSMFRQDGMWVSLLDLVRISHGRVIFSW